MKRLMIALMAAGLPMVAQAAGFDTYVGYADNLRPSPFFPDPWDGSATTALFAGQSGATFDAGAVRIHNSGASNITINDLAVQLAPAMGGPTFALWGSFLGAGFVLGPNEDAIFTQSSFAENFDTSDSPFLGSVPGNTGNDPTNNCSTGPVSSNPICVANAPRLDITIDGVLTSLLDTAHILDTGGYDSVNSNPCIGGNNVAGGNTPGNCNESLQWRLIGTTGVENPGGTVGAPEPFTLALLGSGLAGLGLLRRRKRRA